MEIVGETVASILGIDDSKYQDIIDGMTPEEWEAALAVQAIREREYEELMLHQKYRSSHSSGATDLEICSLPNRNNNSESVCTTIGTNTGTNTGATVKDFE